MSNDADYLFGSLCFMNAQWRSFGWNQFLQRLEERLAIKFDLIDRADPPRLKAAFGPGQGVEACLSHAAESKSVSHLIIARSKRHKLDIQLSFTERLSDCHDIGMNADLISGKEDASTDLCRKAFDVIVSEIQPFYAYVDRGSVVGSYRKATGSVVLERELVGVFWLTYFGPHCVRKIGKEQFRKLGDLCNEFESGIKVQLAPKPADVSQRQRDAAEEALGALHFLDRTGRIDKPVGKYAVSYEDLLKPVS